MKQNKFARNKDVLCNLLLFRLFEALKESEGEFNVCLERAEHLMVDRGIERREKFVSFFLLLQLS